MYAAEALCRNETGAFSEELNSFQEKLYKVLTEDTGSQAEGKMKPGNDKLLYEQIGLLNKACENYSFGDTKKIISLLDEYEWDNDKNKIRQH
ncbi:MAG: hypothetical protein FWC17_00015 [Treponema sp.]|nr:hypothetical protein [Treponema sp.]